MLSLEGFRNYDRAEVEFSPQVNLIAGRNGAGKTNLIEAVHILSSGASHRSSSLEAAVRHDDERAVLRSRALTGDRELAIDAEIRRGGGLRLLINKVPWGKGSKSGIGVVVFSPDDLQLIKGGPDERRRFLDLGAASLRPLAVAERQEFDRALRQRNGALRAAQSNSRALGSVDTWSEQLVKTGAAVTRSRLRLVANLEEPVRRRYSDTAGTGVSVSMEYVSEWVTEGEARLEEDLAQSLLAARSSDLERGLTTVGPHRDDLSLRIAGDARVFASQGEQRSLAIALRLAQYDLLVGVGERPVLLLDDVFSELDVSRRGYLSEAVAGGGQVLITAADPEGVPLAADRVFLVEGGKVLRDG